MNDLVSGGLCLAVSLGLAWVHFAQAGRLHDNFGRDPGPALLPQVLLLCLGLAGLGLSARGLLGLRRTAAMAAPGSVRSLWPALAAVLLMAAFIPLRGLTGAAAALAVIGAALAVLAGRTDTARWPVTALMGGAAGLALYALFHFGLSVPL